MTAEETFSLRRAGANHVQERCATIAYSAFPIQLPSPKSRFMTSVEMPFIHDFILSLPEGLRYRHRTTGHRHVWRAEAEDRHSSRFDPKPEDPPVETNQHRLWIRNPRGSCSPPLNVPGMGETMIAVAHRLSTVQNADLIFVSQMMEAWWRVELTSTLSRSAVSIGKWYVVSCLPSLCSN